MFFVEARYHRNPEKVPHQIRYISHREERLPSGDRRELFGIGDRYRVLRGDEKAIERVFGEDSKGLRRPAYFRFILTVDNRAAERFQPQRELMPLTPLRQRGSRFTSTADTTGPRTRTLASDEAALLALQAAQDRPRALEPAPSERRAHPPRSPSAA